MIKERLEEAALPVQHIHTMDKTKSWVSTSCDRNSKPHGLPPLARWALFCLVFRVPDPNMPSGLWQTSGAANGDGPCRSHRVHMGAVRLTLGNPVLVCTGRYQLRAWAPNPGKPGACWGSWLYCKVPPRTLGSCPFDNTACNVGEREEGKSPPAWTTWH